MNLLSFSYKTAGWELVEMNALNTTNLLVGKNASGKTRIIQALQNVTSMLQMKPIVLGESNFKTKLLFCDPKVSCWKMSYSFEFSNGQVAAEQLIVNNKTVVQRDNAKAVFMGESINPPSGKLVVQVRRDREAYPEIEMLMEWAEGVISIFCSNINPFTIILSGTPNIINPLPFCTIVDSLTKEDKKTVIADARRLGYNIQDMNLVKANSEIKLVAVKEKYVKDAVLDFELSSGMMRVLYLLCFLAYVKHTDKHSLLLIDDLGEGLDYGRATLLGKNVFETCEREGFQMIASSNDSFMMDVVDISKWQILRRKNSKLTVLNRSNTPALFDEFRMTGLSNFDLFSSDFIETYLKDRAE